MKNKSAEKLFVLLEHIDDEFLAEALMVNDRKSLLKTVSKNKSIIFRPLFVKIAIIILCLAIGLSALVIKSEKKELIFVGEHSSALGTSSHEDSENSSFEPQEDKNTSTSKTQQSSSSESYIDYETSSENFSSSMQSQSSQNTESEYEEFSYYFDSIDKVNFYAGKNFIENNGVMQLSGRRTSFVQPLSKSINTTLVPSDHIQIEHIFNFTISLDDYGFLAKKLGGGKGTIEVIIILGRPYSMLIFKCGNNFYNCITEKSLSTSAGVGADTTKRSTMVFSSYKYIEGYDIVDDYQGAEFRFIFNFEQYTASNNNEQYEVNDLICKEIFSVVDEPSEDITVSNIWADTIVVNKSSVKALYTSTILSMKELETYATQYVNNN